MGSGIRWLSAFFIFACIFSVAETRGNFIGETPSFASEPQTHDLPWSVCLHAGDADYNIADVRIAFQRIRDMGATSVRTDFDWGQLEPSPGEWNPHAIEFFNEYINEAHNYGLEVILILSHPAHWASVYYEKGDLNQFLKYYSLYAEKMASLYGDRVRYYQYWNESNSPSGFFKTEDIWQVLLAADQGVRRFNKLSPQGIVNYTTDAVLRYTWKKQLRDTFERINHEDPAHTIRIIAIDLYPSTWSLKASWGGWGPVDDLSAILTDPAHPCFGFNAAITETGYSQGVRAPLNKYIGRGEQSQANWFKEAIPFLNGKLEEFNFHHTSQFLWAGIYELYDHSDDSLNPEGFFGLYHHDRTPKVAVEVIRSLLLKSNSQHK